MTVNTQGASQTLIESLQARIAELDAEDELHCIMYDKAVKRIAELNDYNKKMIENYQSSLDELQEDADRLFQSNGKLANENGLLQAVVDRLANKKPFINEADYTDPEGWAIDEENARIEYAKKHKSK